MNDGEIGNWILESGKETRRATIETRSLDFLDLKILKVKRNNFFFDSEFWLKNLRLWINLFQCFSFVIFTFWFWCKFVFSFVFIWIFGKLILICSRNVLNCVLNMPSLLKYFMIIYRFGWGGCAEIMLDRIAFKYGLEKLGYIRIIGNSGYQIVMRYQISGTVLYHFIILYRWLKFFC